VRVSHCESFLESVQVDCEVPEVVEGLFAEQVLLVRLFVGEEGEGEFGLSVLNGVLCH
jgi:hypothetical protein